jgi:hypothetical protein
MAPAHYGRMALGALATAAATMTAAAAYGAAAVAAQRRQWRMGRSTSAAPLLFATITAYLAVAALRQGAAWLSGMDPAWVEVDRFLFLVVIVPAAVVIAPHVHLVSLVAWGRARLSRGLAAAFLALVFVALAFAYLEGVEGPVTSPYGTDWTLRSPVTKVLLLTVIMLPGLLGSAGLVWMARRLDAAGRRRVGFIGWSCLVYFLVFTLDAFGLSGILLLAARLATAATGLLAWLAYRPRPAPPPPTGPAEDSLYER